ncbi:MAG: NusG domain II-containing protein [Firmicutes bacterium]|nr:NusG domain II-containing protein [Bacillota bacterium]
MKKGDLVLIAALAILFVGSWMYIKGMGSDQVTAIVLQDGVVIHEIDLSNVNEPYQIRVENEQGGYNIIEVDRGRIRVVEANCPEQVDVLQGWISEPHESLVCLPHRLVVKIQAQPKSDVDGIVR